MGDVFSLSRGAPGHDSRVVRVAAAPIAVRIRSTRLWVGLHWVEQSVLCAGSRCACCELGFTKRRYAMVAVDRPQGTVGVLQLTERDLCLLEGLDSKTPESMRIGSQFRVWRSASRQPMSAEFLGFTEKILPVSQEALMVDVLRIHGIAATEADVRDGGLQQLVANRSLEAANPRRAMA